MYQGAILEETNKSKSIISRIFKFGMNDRKLIDKCITRSTDDSMFYDNAAAKRLAKRYNSQINRQLKIEEKARKRESLVSFAKSIILGSSDSGKSTILKQLKIIHNNGFTEKEIALYRDTIRTNLLEAFKQLVKLAFSMDRHFDSDYSTIIQGLLDDTLTIDKLLVKKTANALYNLWSDDKFQKHFKRHYKTVHDTIPYFFDRIEWIFETDYVPDNDAIVRVKLSTIEVTETIFSLQINGYCRDLHGKFLSYKLF